jgi:Kef-type K+ transport system membrane component KefB
MAGVSTLFLDLGIILIIAAVAAFIFKLFKQPQILSYVLVGVLIGPIFTFFAKKTIVDSAMVEATSIIGIAFLLFIVGLEMDIKSLKNVTLVSSLGGATQIAVIFGIGYLVALAIGFLSLEATYIGLILAFSSTMVVLKLLSDKRELQTLHGRITIGILLMQDIVAIFALSILTSVEGFSLLILGNSVIKFLGIFIVAYIASKYLFPRIFKFAAMHHELLLISSLAVCFIFSLIFHYLGFSIAIGAFIAGITLGNLQYNIEIIGKVKSLKDFFSLLFFVSLGMGLSVMVIKSRWLTVLILLLVIMVIKPIVIMAICSIFKYTKKPSFLTANALAQVGEFSLILAAQGLALGHISKELFSITVFITLASITLTSYYIQFNKEVYKLLKYPLKIFDIFTTEGLEYLPKKTNPKIILCGHNRIGYSILHNLSKRKEDVLVIDFNPEIIGKMVKDGYHCIYGDVTDEEIIERMRLSKIDMLISTIPGFKDNSLLIRKIRTSNKRAKVIVTSGSVEEALKLYEAGADYVVLPHFLGGEHVSHLITKFKRNKHSLKEEKRGHIHHLKNRKKVGHQHPSSS